MPRINPTTPLITATGLGVLLAFAPGAYAQNSEAPVKDGVSQVKITLTSDNGGSCVLDSASAKAGPVTFSVTNDLQLDLRAGVGLNEAADDYFVGSGFAIRH